MDTFFGSDAKLVLDRAGRYLRRHPVMHNQVLGQLADKVDEPDPGGTLGYVSDSGEVVGVYVHSPAGRHAVITAETDDHAVRLAEAAFAADPTAPGVHGTASTAAAFAGRWSELAKVPVTPTEGRRLYRLEHEVIPVDVGGVLRPATADDLPLVASWRCEFVTERGGSITQPEATDWVAKQVDRKRLWLWVHDGDPVATAAATQPIEKVARVGAVYTPTSQRRRGYGSAVAAAVTATLVSGGSLPVLYTDLHNPTSNGIYRRLGFRPVQELLIYRSG